MQSRNIKSSYPAIFFRAGRLDLILIRHRLRNVSVFTVRTGTKIRRKRRFQKIPLWGAFSQSYVFGDRFHQIRVDGRRIRKEKVVLSNENGYVGTDPWEMALQKISDVMFLLDDTLSNQLNDIEQKNSYVTLSRYKRFLTSFIAPRCNKDLVIKTIGKVQKKKT